MRKLPIILKVVLPLAFVTVVSALTINRSLDKGDTKHVEEVLSRAKCPIHDVNCHFTGNTKSVDGKQLKEYSCSRGHKFWVVK